MCCDWRVIEYSTTGPHVGGKVNMTPFSLVVITPRSSANSFSKVQPGFFMRRMCEMGEQSQRSPATGNMPRTCEGLTFKCQPHPRRAPLRLAPRWDSLRAWLSQPPSRSMTWTSHLFDIRWVFISRSLFWIRECWEKKRLADTRTQKKNIWGWETPREGTQMFGSGLRKGINSSFHLAQPAACPGSLSLPSSQYRKHFPFKWHLSADMLEAPILHHLWQMVQLATIFGIA